MGRANADVPLRRVGTVIRVCHHLFATNFVVLSTPAKVLWFYAASQSSEDGVVHIHLRVMPRLAGLTEEEGNQAIEELGAHNFYDDDKPPFLQSYETKNWCVSTVLRWECSYCDPVRRDLIPEEIRRLVLSAGFCAHCANTGILEVDHIRPVTLGGTNDRSNLQALCISCNRKKGNRFVG